MEREFDLPEIVHGELNGELYAAQAYTKAGARVPYLDSDRRRDGSLDVGGGQVIAEFYGDKGAVIHVLWPKEFVTTKPALDAAQTNVVTLRAIEAGHDLPPVIDAEASPSTQWRGEHRAVTIGENDLSKVIVFLGKEKQNPLQPDDPTPLDDDLQAVFDLLSDPGVQYTIEQALVPKQHRGSTFGKIVRRLLFGS